MHCSRHADTVPEAWVQHCVQRGVRTSIPSQGGAFQWRHRYMLWGLYVDTEPWTDPPQVWRVQWHQETPAVIEAFRAKFVRAQAVADVVKAASTLRL